MSTWTHQKSHPHSNWQSQETTKHRWKFGDSEKETCSSCIPSEEVLGCLGFTICFKHGCKLHKPVTFFGVDVRERNHRQLRWTLTYWRVSKTQTIPGWNGIENAIIKKDNSLPNGTLMVDSPWWKLKNRLKETPQETREFHTQLHTTWFVFLFSLPKCGAALEAAVTPRAVTSLEIESPRDVGMFCW